jgi:antitoxin HicB
MDKNGVNMQYLAVIEKTDHGFSATVPDLADSVVVSAKTLDKLRTRLSEAIAIYLLEVPHAPAATSKTLDDLSSEYLADFAAPEALFITPTPINPVSLELSNAIEASGLSLRQMAERMNTIHSAIARLINPLYWGQSLDSLRRFAEILDKQLLVKLQ